MIHRSLLIICAAACISALIASSASAAEEATTISGKVFADLTNLDLENDGIDSPANGTGVDVKRFYVGVAHNFDDTWSASITSDFNYVSNDNETQIYIKKAYLQAKLSDALIGRLGSADMPWIGSAEDQYGFRYVELTIIDRLKYGTSADWGVHATGKISDGLFNYAVSVVNGAGYKNPTRSNSMDVEARVGFKPIDGLTLLLGGYSGKLGKDVEGTATPPLHTANRFDALVGYVNGPLRLGAEYFQARNWYQVTSPTSDSAAGVSVWGSYDFTSKWGVFARGDWAKTSKDVNPDLKDEYFNAGAVCHPRKNVDVALVYKHETVDGGGTITSANGTIGGVKEGIYNEVGIWAQVNF